MEMKAGCLVSRFGSVVKALGIPDRSQSKSVWADCAAVQAQCENLSGNELTRNLSGNIWLQSSPLAEPLWTDFGINGAVTVRKLIFNYKKKEAQAGNE